MKRSILPAIAALSLIATGAAYASSDAQGIITAMNPARTSITLSNGVTYALPDSARAEGLKVGARVLVFGDNVDQGDVTSVVVIR
jgi:hypothetical protein